MLSSTGWILLSLRGSRSEVIPIKFIILGDCLVIFTIANINTQIIGIGVELGKGGALRGAVKNVLADFAR